MGTTTPVTKLEASESNQTRVPIRSSGIRDTLRWYYYPSVSVNANDVAAVGFSGSSTIEYAGGYYTVLRPPSYNPAEPVSLMKAGEASYYKTLSGTANRWGDFSATVVDPSDDVTFWTLQEYAMTRDPVTLASRWGTWSGQFHPSDVTAPAGLTATVSPLPQVVLNWTDASGNETGFKVERRRLPGEDYIPIATLPQNVPTFTDNASTGLLLGITYSYRVLAFNAAGGSYSGEAFASIPSPIPDPALTSLTPSSATAGNPGFTERIGRAGVPFTVIKVRTMREIPPIHTTVTPSSDLRITPLGRFFRKTKIDELPQLINVFLGQMSFVGPRPDVPGFADKLIREDRIVLSVRPGITGPATLEYRKEEEFLAGQDDPEKYNNEVIFPDKVRLNREYVLNYRFCKDIKYIYQTIIG